MQPEGYTAEGEGGSGFRVNTAASKWRLSRQRYTAKQQRRVGGVILVGRGGRGGWRGVMGP